MRGQSRRLREAIDLAGQTGDRFLLCQTLHGMGDMLLLLCDHAAAEPWYRQSLGLAREINDKWSIYGTLSHLGDGYLALGRLDRAQESFAEGLRLACETGARSYQGMFFKGLGRVAHRKGASVRAVRLWGAGSAVANPDDARPDPVLLANVEMDEPGFRREWAVGRAMTPQQAVRYALEEEGPG